VVAVLADHIISLDEDGEIAWAFYERGSRADRQCGFHGGHADHQDHQWRNDGRGSFAPYPDPDYNTAPDNLSAPNNADNADEPNDQPLRGSNPRADAEVLLQHNFELSLKHKGKGKDLGDLTDRQLPQAGVETLSVSSFRSNDDSHGSSSEHA
jgi:hypothetical protein